jgi:hypothetical protein
MTGLTTLSNKALVVRSTLHIHNVRVKIIPLRWVICGWMTIETAWMFEDLRGFQKGGDGTLLVLRLARASKEIEQCDEDD